MRRIGDQKKPGFSSQLQQLNILKLPQGGEHSCGVHMSYLER